MSAPVDATDRHDIVRLRAVFVPDGQTPPPELLEGMTDIVRLDVRMLNGGSDTSPGPRDGTDQDSAQP